MFAIDAHISLCGSVRTALYPFAVRLSPAAVNASHGFLPVATMAAIWHHLDIYKVPRASVDVEAIAQGLARYLQMTAEDTEVLSQDPTRRDKLVAELYKRPGVKPNCFASQFVQPGGDPDAHLVPANAEIAKLTPPKTFEE